MQCVRKTTGAASDTARSVPLAKGSLSFRFDHSEISTFVASWSGKGNIAAFKAQANGDYDATQVTALYCKVVRQLELTADGPLKSNVISEHVRENCHWHDAMMPASFEGGIVFLVSDVPVAPAFQFARFHRRTTRSRGILATARSLRRLPS